jgi:acyl-coenzyme A synthetase/AMP-(fatty) acid ligase
MGGIFGIYGALLNGATLFPKDIKRDGLGNIVNWMKTSRITVYHSVTTLFRQLVSLVSQNDRFPDLRLIILGGEQVLHSDIMRGREAFTSQIEFYCGSGSIRHFPIDADTSRSTRVQCRWVTRSKVSRSCSWTPIAVRSPYLSTEYWRRPELNRERFIRNPEGGPLPVYVTGDYGRINSSGCLISRGRSDQQVKIRGFRVEPAEIDAAVLDLPAIQGSRTIAVPDQKGSHTLACFYVCRASEKITEESIRHHLRTELPAYMIPNSLVELEVFPRTANGKIDTHSLKVPALRRSPERICLNPPLRNASLRSGRRFWTNTRCQSIKGFSTRVAIPLPPRR